MTLKNLVNTVALLSSITNCLLQIFYKTELLHYIPCERSNVWFSHGIPNGICKNTWKTEFETVSTFPQWPSMFFPGLFKAFFVLKRNELGLHGEAREKVFKTWYT